MSDEPDPNYLDFLNRKPPWPLTAAFWTCVGVVVVAIVLLVTRNPWW